MAISRSFVATGLLILLTETAYLLAFTLGNHLTQAWKPIGFLDGCAQRTFDALPQAMLCPFIRHVSGLQR
jgi:hypothetical protein